MSEFSLTQAYDTVNLWRAGGAAKIELNRPETMNAWNRQFGLDLLAAIRAVREARGGKLGFNAKFIIETGEEIGSPDLRQVCESLRDELTADLFLASDGPRLSADRPTIFLGCRGGIRIHLEVKLREGSHHSGNWGGLIANPGFILAHALASIVGPNGELLVEELKAPHSPRSDVATTNRWTWSLPVPASSLGDSGPTWTRLPSDASTDAMRSE